MNSLEHVDDYPEIPVSMASTRTALKTGGWRSVRPMLAERTAPCSAGCPAGVTVAAYAHDLAAGRLESAFARFTEHNPFPRITGRVCPHTCEDACNLAIVTEDDAVSIRAIERWLGDATADFEHPRLHPDTGRRVAVVGSGPAGMAAAYYLRRSGHAVTVLERDTEPGGMLRRGVPEYRLPAAVVDDEIERLRRTGVVFRTGVELGAGVTIENLTADFDAVFVATGACLGRPVGIPGEEHLAGGLEFLDSVSRGATERPGAHCAVIGGGNTAMDVARVLRRMGSEVTVVYRRTADEMPAIREEFLRAIDDGVEFAWLTQPRAVTSEGDRLRLVVEEMELGEPDASGRARPQPTGRTDEMVFDAVFSAVGELADLEPFPSSVLGDDGWLKAGVGGATADPAVHVGGDLVTGPATVIEAIVAGREAARSIDARFGFSDRWPAEVPTAVVDPDEVNPAVVARHRRVEDPSRHGADPMAEETATISAPEVFGEIERCMSCGHCNECGTCFVFCPDGAISWEEGPVVDLEFCKGCGICVTECPGRAMILINEREAVHA